MSYYFKILFWPLPDFQIIPFLVKSLKRQPTKVFPEYMITGKPWQLFNCIKTSKGKTESNW